MNNKENIYSFDNFDKKILLQYVSEDTFHWLDNLGFTYRMELISDLFDGTSYHLHEIAESDGIDPINKELFDSYKKELSKLFIYLLMDEIEELYEEI